ncbi:MAG: MBL fold metallo-hydrolase [Acidobacteria bacterium]|nr:MBL fold metallo-hydrolase [Acidobacteriota bacterium]
MPVFFEQFKVEGLGCYSYLIGCPGAGAAFVVDPERHVDRYLEAAEREGMTITHIFDTHLHADHISGAVELADKSGADIYVHPEVRGEYRHKTLRGGDRFSFGVAKVEVLETPGHTPNSVTLAVADTARSPETMLLLTGDLLFVGDIGRPDLAGEDMLQQQVRNLYDSLYKTLSRFGDWVEVYPAHGAGSLCGKGMSSKPMSTLGFERKNNPLLNNMPFEEFRRIMTGGFQLRPPGFAEIVRRNRASPKALGTLREVGKLSVFEVENLRKQGAVLVDVRQATSFGASFIPGSLNIGLTPQSATWLGMVARADKNIVIVSDTETDAHAAAYQFRRVGFDKILGFLDGGVSNWAMDALPLDHLPQLSVQSLRRVMEKYPDHIVLDVRTAEEWSQGHIENIRHKPVADLVREGVDIEDKSRHISLICESGHRSNIAGSLLKAAGYEHTYSVIGGMSAWRKLQRMS